MAVTSFGQVIPVTGPNIGFAGTVSRFGERVIVARQVNPAATLNLNFGDPAVIVPNTEGGYHDSILDFLTAAPSNVGLLASQWAGVAVREVKTDLVYMAGQTPGLLQVGYYSPGQMSEVLERGSMTVPLSVGAPSTIAQVYSRVVLNGAVTAGTIGDYETNPAATDLFTTTATTTEGSTAVTLGSATNTKNGQLISGAGIAPGSYIVSGGGTTAVVLNNPATATFATLGSLVTISNLFTLPNVVTRTGYVDSNGMVEITLKIRVAA